MREGCGTSTEVKGECMEPVRVDDRECIAVAANRMGAFLSDGMPELNVKTQRGKTAPSELAGLWLPFLELIYERSNSERSSEYH